MGLRLGASDTLLHYNQATQRRHIQYLQHTVSTALDADLLKLLEPPDLANALGGGRVVVRATIETPPDPFPGILHIPAPFAGMGLNGDLNSSESPDPTA